MNSSKPKNLQSDLFCVFSLSDVFPVDIYLFKINNRNIKKSCEICSKLTVKTPERCQYVFIVNFEHISHLLLVFLLLT